MRHRALKIVIPLIAQGTLLGALDIDSPTPARFDEIDRGSGAPRCHLSRSEPRLTDTPAGKGLLAGLSAYIMWGLFPLYLKPLHAVGTFEVIAHRVVWSCVFILIVMAATKQLDKLRAALTSPALLARLALSASLITVNWVMYVYAVANGHVLEASLGYFINPLLNVLLGVVILSERLNPAQWASVGLAGIAVLYLALIAGNPPWISLTVATTFGLYGFIRKVIAVEALPGLAVETLLLVPLAAGYLLWLEAGRTGAMGHSGPAIDALLLGSGAITALPLFLFAYGARLIPYSTMGLIQYIAPSLQLILGLVVFGETLQHSRAVGFVLIWAALAIYAADGLWRARARPRSAPQFLPREM
jgi:chloramphenicol-sensitive protein RarD